MKKLFSIAACFSLAFSMFATGSLNITPSNIIAGNPSQTGTFTFTGTNQSGVVTFPIPFPVVPAVYTFGTTTNLGLLTNVVTSTNLTVTTANTNGTIIWVATYPYERIQSGTQSVTNGTPNVVTFPVPYSSVPVVVAVGGLTNSAVGVTAITTTNFTIAGNTQTAQWQSIGPAYNPGPNVVNY